MAFPNTSDLGTKVMLGVGGAWTDVTPYAYLASPITITRGRADEGARTDYGRCSIVFNNQDGRFSPRNPMSPYYGLIGRNTPLRVSVNAGSAFLNTTGTVDRARVADRPSIDITGDIDIRVWLRTEMWSSPDPVEIAGKWTPATGARSWLMFLYLGRLYFYWTVDGATQLTSSSTAPPVPPPNGSLALRATLDVDNGAAGRTVTFYTAASINGPWTQLGSPVVQAGTTSIFNSTQPMEVGSVGSIGFTDPVAQFFAFQLLNGINGPAVANVDFTAQTLGATSFVDSAGVTWTLNGNASISNERVRFVGEIPNWPVSWSPSGKDARTSVTGAGALRRLGQGAKALHSTLRRRVPSFGPLAYWPMEEAAGATQAYSPIKGVRPMQVSGISFASDNTLVGSDALPTVGTATAIHGTVSRPLGLPTSWHVEWVYKLTAAPASSSAVMQITSTGTVALWTMFLAAGVVRILGQDGDGVTVVDVSYSIGSDLYDGRWNRWRFYATVSGTTVTWNNAWINIGGSGSAVSGTYTGTLGRITTVGSPVQFPNTLSGMSLGHISVFSPSQISAYDNADTGFNGETTGTRMARVASEEGVPITLYGDPSTQDRMGPQRPVSLLDLLSDASEVDGGILYERRSAVGLAYRDLNGLYNQPVALALDYTAKGNVSPPLQPVDDDQSIHNDVTVTRVNGSSARVSLDSGPMSTQAPPNGVGQYAGGAVTLNLYDDTQTEQQAGWRMHLGTWDEARYPSVKINLAKAPSLIDTATAMDSGDLISVANLPNFLPPDDLLLMSQGYSEVIGTRTWDITFNCTPGRPWSTIAVADDPDSHADTNGCQLAGDLTTTGTIVPVTTTSGPMWTPDPTDTPFDIQVGGEVMTVQAVGQTLNSNPGFEVDTTGWTATSATLVRSNAQAKIGSWSGLLTVTTGTSPRAESSQYAVTAGLQYRAYGWLYAPAALAVGPGVNVNWFDANHAFLSTSSRSIPSPTGSWSLCDAVFTAPAGAAFASVLMIVNGTPATGTQLHGDEIRLVPVATYDGLSPVALNSNPGFEVDTAGWTATSATFARSTAQAKLGSASGLLTVTTGASPRAESSQYPITAGSQYRAYGWLYAPAAMAGGATISINWFDVNHTYLSTSVDSRVPATAAWELRDTTFTAPAGSAYASVLFQPSGSPASGTLLYGDDVRIAPAAPTQVFTIARSVNGIVKAHSEGDSVSLANPRFAAL